MEMRTKVRRDLKLRLDELESRDALLSARERHVLSLILRGRLNKSMARELHVTERTIENVRGRLMKKFHVNSIAELVVAATELRILRSIQNDDTSMSYPATRLSESRKRIDIPSTNGEC